MYTLYKFHFLIGISEINQLFDDILIIWPAPVYIYIYINSFANLIVLYLISLEWVTFEILKRYNLCVHVFFFLWVAMRSLRSNKITPTPRQVHIHQFELSK